MRAATIAALAVCWTTAALAIGTGEDVFKRGDADGDLLVDISDPIHLYAYLFQGGDAPLCFDAADANDDGQLDNSDVIYLYSYLLSGGAPPPDPGPAFCGSDPTEDSLTCDDGGCD